MSRFEIDRLYDEVFALFAREGEQYLHPMLEWPFWQEFSRAVQQLAEG